MESAEYQILKEYESWYWWYLAQRANVRGAVEALPLRPGMRILDAGCGTGRNLSELADVVATEMHGMDVSELAAETWNGRAAFLPCIGSVNALPYSEESFDVIVSVDVLGSRGVDVDRAVNEMARVLRNDGYMILLVPAYEWMKSRHDAAVHSERRFSRPILRALVESAGFSVIRMTHRFLLLFPLIAAVRVARKLLGRSRNARSDLSPLPRILNDGLLRIVRWEQSRFEARDLPIGSTILLVAQKKAACR